MRRRWAGERFGDGALKNQHESDVRMDVPVNPLARFVDHFGEHEAADAAPPDDVAVREAFGRLRGRHGWRHPRRFRVALSNWGHRPPFSPLFRALQCRTWPS